MRGKTAIGLTIAAVTSVASGVAAQPTTPAPPEAGSGSNVPPPAPSSEPGGGTSATVPPDAPPAPATPAAPAEEENLLANLDDKPDKIPGDTGNEGATSSFGAQLQLFGLEASWSGYGDAQFAITPKNRKEATFDAYHFNPIMSLRIADGVTGEIEIEYEHGGDEILVEYSVIDWAPAKSRAFGIRAGKFLVPIGRFNEHLHPSFRWSQVTRPTMMRDVIPGVWGEVGVQVRGTLGEATQFDYAAYVVNGLGGDIDPMDDEPVRHLRGNVEDNNFDKGVGGRIALAHKVSSKESASLGLSAYSGKVNDAGSQRLTIVDADAQLLLGGLSLNAEYAQSYFGTKGSYFESLQRGGYVQLGYTVGKSTVAGRYDYVKAGPLMNPGDARQQVVGTFRYAPAPAWSLRTEVVLPFAPSGATDDLTILCMITFVF